MALKFYKLYKIDRANETASAETFENLENIENYVSQVIEKHRSKYEREYKFRDGEETAKNNVMRILKDESLEEACQTMANRLLDKERVANDRIKHMGHEIPTSMFIVAQDDVTEDETQLFFIKADYDEYIMAGSGNDGKGLPKNRKIFKSCVFFAKKVDGDYEVYKIMSHDENSSSSDAAYWYRDFLDLQELTSDEKNSTTSFNAVKKDLLNPIKKKHKKDYMYLRNQIIAYFRSEGEFDIDHFANVIIGSYVPYDQTLDINDLKAKCLKLPEKYNFDKKFTKKPEVIKDKFKDSIILTQDLELKIKQDIQDIDKVIVGGIDQGDKKYIKIYSEEGYNYASGLKRP